MPRISPLWRKLYDALPSRDAVSDVVGPFVDEGYNAMVREALPPYVRPLAYVAKPLAMRVNPVTAWLKHGMRKTKSDFHRGPANYNTYSYRWRSPVGYKRRNFGSRRWSFRYRRRRRNW